MKSKKMSITLSLESDTIVSRRYANDGRHTRSSTISRLVARYAEVMRRRLGSISLSEDEWHVILLAADARSWRGAALVALPAIVADEIIERKLDKVRHVNGARLVETLGSLDFSGRCAVVDMVEQVIATEADSGEEAALELIRSVSSEVASSSEK